MRHVLIVAGVLAPALGILALPSAVRAQAFISGAVLAKACAANSREGSSCDAFIAGAMDEAASAPELKAKVCLPTGTKLKVLRESVASFAAERPEATHGSGVALVNAMVLSHFPCPQPAARN